MDYQLKEAVLPRSDSYSVIENIFATRGIAPNEIQKYLSTTDEDILSPEQIARIHEGVMMLMWHIKRFDKILVIVDCDVDGFTSAALLINYINRLFPGYAQNYIDWQLHSGKQHGIEENFIPYIIKNNYQLVICPDSSSNDYAAHEQLREGNAIDVLVIDHHEAEKVSEYACVINNQLCDYPTKSLSGVGMVYKFCCYLDSLLDKNFANDFIDLVAIGMIGDMMSLRDRETKHLIYKGLANIKNPFVREIVRAQNYSISRAGGLNPFSVSFYIAPAVNATIRVGAQAEKELLFESMLEFMAYKEIPSTKRGFKGKYEALVEQACRNCNNIKNHQTKARDASLLLIDNLIKDNQLDKDKIIVVRLKNSYHIDKNITGLIANNLVAKYQHPILLLHEIIDEDGVVTWEGSGRSYVTKTFTDLRKFLKDSGYAYLAEGHSNALGVGIQDIDGFTEYANRVLADCDFTPCYKVDFIWQNNMVRPNDIINIAELDSIWGQDMDQPLVAIERINITKSNLTLLSPDKSPTLKITLPNGISLIKFKSSQEEYEALLPETDYGATQINIVGVCHINEWNDKITPQVEIKDYEISQVQKYLF